MKKATLDKLQDLNPITDAQVTASLTATDRETRLHDLISTATSETPQPLATSTPSTAASAPPPASSAPTAGDPSRGRRRVVRLAVRTALPAAVAAGVLAAVLVARPEPVTPPTTQPTQPVAAAVQFFPQGKYLVIKVVDPYADSARINKELADRGLHIKLNLVPSSPSVVGTNPGIVIEGGMTIDQSTEPANCWKTGARPCVPVFRIPKDFKGSAELQIGRAAKPGESYDSAGQVDAPGELLHGMKYQNKTVGEVKAMLATHGGTISRYDPAVIRWRTKTPGGLYMDPELVQMPPVVPDNWYVRFAAPLKPGEIMVQVAPTPGIPNRVAGG